MTSGGPRSRRSGGERPVGRLLEDAYATRVGVDTAARHLWSVDREARRLARRRRRQRLATTAMSVVLLLAGVGTVAGSATAVPGQALYPVKDGLERAELTMAVSDSAQARAHLRHSRARLDELEQVADSEPQLVPQLAARFYDSLQRAAESGDEGIASEVAALRNAAAVLLDRLARELDPSVVRSLAAVRGVPDSVAAIRPASDASASSGAHAGRDGASRPGSAGGSDAAAGDDSGSPAGEPMVATPETAVAGAGPAPDGGEPAPSPAEGASETAVAAPSPQTSVAEPVPETDTAEAAPDAPTGAPTPTPTPTPTPPSQPPPAHSPPESTTSQAGTSDPSPEDPADGDGGSDGEAGSEP